MAIQRSTKTDRLTPSDSELFGRIAYAMVVVGLWKKVVRRTDDCFDFFEITGQKGEMAYRIGRLSDGAYVLFAYNKRKNACFTLYSRRQRQRVPAFAHICQITGDCVVGNDHINQLKIRLC